MSVDLTLLAPLGEEEWSIELQFRFAGFAVFAVFAFSVV